MEELIGTHEGGKKERHWILASLQVVFAVVLGASVVVAYWGLALWRGWGFLAIFGWAIPLMILWLFAGMRVFDVLDPKRPGWDGAVAFGLGIPYLAFPTALLFTWPKLFRELAGALPFEPAWLGVAAVGLFLIFTKTGRFLVIAGLLLWIGSELSAAA